jgi:hypothetical protein
LVFAVRAAAGKLNLVLVSVCCCPSAPLQKNTTAIDTLDEELRSIDFRQAELKKLLYAKFGRAINLEDR